MLGLALALLVARPSSAAKAEEPRRAEYAIRWNPAEGGPASAAEVLELLGAAEASHVESEVRYYDLPRPEGAPAGAAVILRRRSFAGGREEIRLKYRLSRPLAAGAWGCPAGADFRPSEEVDVGFGGAAAPSRVYSYSCTLAAAAPPPFLRATGKKCASRVVRYDAGPRRGEGYKVEAWTLPNGATRLEISRSAPNSVDELAAFETLVEKLTARGARPLAESKTELGSRCP